MLLADLDYKEGFGKDVTGGAGQSVYHVTSSSPDPNVPGSFMNAILSPWTGQNIIQNKTIVFDVDTFSVSDNVYIGANVTIDGIANGKNGVTFDHGGVGDVLGTPSQPWAKRALLLFEGSHNVIMRGINFQGYGWPNVEATHPTQAQPEYNFLWLAVGSFANGGEIADVLVDRCTFTRATNKAFDVTSGGGFTGRTRNVTFQRCLIHDCALGSHVKYADGAGTTREKISYHHNVWVHNGERQPQLVDAVGLIDLVNNIVYANTGDVGSYPDGTPVSPYGFRAWNTSAAGQILRGGAVYDPFHGNVLANLEGNAFLGSAGSVVILSDTAIPADPAPASDAGVYIGADNFFSAPANQPSSLAMTGATTTGAAVSSPVLPWHTKNVIPAAYQVTKLPVADLALQMLPYVGAPNRTALDTQRISEVAAQLTAAPPPPPPPPPPTTADVDITVGGLTVRLAGTVIGST